MCQDFAISQLHCFKFALLNYVLQEEGPGPACPRSIPQDQERKRGSYPRFFTPVCHKKWPCSRTLPPFYRIVVNALSSYFPQRNGKCLNIARQYAQLNDWPTCRRYVGAYIQDHPNSAPALRLLAECESNLGNKESALNNYRSSLTYDSNQKDVVFKGIFMHILAGGFKLFAVKPNSLHVWQIILSCSLPPSV
jgi:tetratricopeptide (TPR) repeat protein